MKKTIAFVFIASVFFIFSLFYPAPVKSLPEAPVPEPEPAPRPALTHAQQVWVSALEWCESSGNPNAINEVDLDGTPSYGAFQFKPSTFWYYAERFDVEVPTPKADQESFMQYEAQRAVVEQMVLHRDEIRWHNEFPWCVKKLGTPPLPHRPE